MSNVEFRKEKIQELAAEKYTVKQMADILKVNEEKLELFYIACHKQNKYAFPLRNLLTKEWLEEMTQKTTILNIASYCGVYPSRIRSLMTQYGLQKQTIKKMLSPEIMYGLYIKEKLSANQIAERYNCSVDTVKKLASTYKLDAKNRQDTIDIDQNFFHLLFIKLGFSYTQLAEMLNCSAFYIANDLRKKMIDLGGPLAKDIENKKKKATIYHDIIELLFEKLEPTVLLELLKTKTVTELAEAYDIIPKTGYELYSKEWLEHLLTKKTLIQISKDFNTPYDCIKKLKIEYGLSDVHIDRNLDVELIRTLFIKRGWSNEEIASLLKISPNTLTSFRTLNGIIRKGNLFEILPQEEFETLYLKEDATLNQISKIYDISLQKATTLLQHYGETNHTFLTHLPKGISHERLEYLKKKRKFPD